MMQAGTTGNPQEETNKIMDILLAKSLTTCKVERLGYRLIEKHCLHFSLLMFMAGDLQWKLQLL